MVNYKFADSEAFYLLFIRGIAMNQQSTEFGQQRRADFGRYLKDLRDQRDRTQIEVEDSLHMKPGRLSLIESGDRPVSDQLLVQLAGEYGVPPEELVMKKYWPQLPFPTGAIEPTEFLAEFQKELRLEEVTEVRRYIAFLLLRRVAANKS